MDRKAALFTLVIVLVLLVSGGGASALPSHPPGPAAVTDPFAHFFLASDPIHPSWPAPIHPWWATHTLVDASGGVHATFYDSEFIYYAYCAAECGDPANWTQTPLFDAGDSSSLNWPVLALDSDDHLRMMRYAHPHYVYAECDGNCTQAGQWTSVDVPLPSELLTIHPSNVRYFALGTGGGAHLVALYWAGFVYATCDADCTLADNWQAAMLDLGGSLDDAQIAVNANGQPRVVGINNDDQLDYAQCNADCLLAENWDRVTLYDGVGNLLDNPSFSLRLDAQGRPRIAFYRANVNDPDLNYAWSNADFASPASWSSYALELPAADDRTVDLALDAGGRPHVAFASDTLDMRYAQCSADCESTDAVWQVQDVETSDELDASDPIPPDPGCLVSTWMLKGFPSLALDAAGNPNVSYYVEHAQYCDSNILKNAWGIRFATAGDAGQDGQRVYLPYITR